MALLESFNETHGFDIKLLYETGYSAAYIHTDVYTFGTERLAGHDLADLSKILAIIIKQEGFKMLMR